MALLLLTTLTVYAQAGKAKFTAIIKNSKSDSLVIERTNFKQVVKASKPGKFNATLIIPDKHIFGCKFDGEIFDIYLQDGFDIDMMADADNFYKTLTFTGKGAKENNFLLLRRNSFSDMYTSLKNVTTIQQANVIMNGYVNKLKTAMDDKEIDWNFRFIMVDWVNDDIKQATAMSNQYIEFSKMKGQPSPSFSFENYKGGTTTLEDFKGKYVYITIWASYCKQCCKYLPDVKTLEDKYKGKNIAFVNISYDRWAEHWKKYLNDGNFGGTHLHKDSKEEGPFGAFYKVDNIPRFILIDPQGNVIDGNAATPDEPELQAKLDTLLK